jgi:hypothetical protein
LAADTDFILSVDLYSANGGLALERALDEIGRKTRERFAKLSPRATISGAVSPIGGKYP